eukprot:Gregarina_sp_Poly_1__5350@NODE_2828_length_1665_cov_82_896120_g1783_i0_p1_GENE_NODE_2828_length_1665_cov_82_896120_g1783_i0NODE_2828_length_1665_cov_82_896120_g1783_i0_p1_ORF_typecomplete_len364_score17_00ProkRING_4/PF14447_6/1_4e05zfC3HC4/PF00097_25/4_3e05zfRING_5/PF14634_6/0_00043zfC3HC4_3/PF13920_6/0_0005zfC3HC4_3/PF13920_6/1_1e04zfC3HC4_4/PF15227_6/0_0025zfRING_6/PF14835_6/0_018zfRING_UBOX/PF13445_6/0_047zfANAPC11/PF12861_7/0_055zfRING_2/PF13639_6/0_052zfC3HC4_2/PF13923_6/0_11CREPT/PF16566_5
MEIFVQFLLDFNASVIREIQALQQQLEAKRDFNHRISKILESICEPQALQNISHYQPEEPLVPPPGIPYPGEWHKIAPGPGWRQVAEGPSPYTPLNLSFLENRRSIPPPIQKCGTCANTGHESHQLLCGHIFCINCLVKLVKDAAFNVHKPLDCPSCNASVSVDLLSKYLKEEQNLMRLYKDRVIHSVSTNNDHWSTSTGSFRHMKRYSRRTWKKLAHRQFRAMKFNQNLRLGFRSLQWERRRTRRLAARFPFEAPRKFILVRTTSLKQLNGSKLQKLVSLRHVSPQCAKVIQKAHISASKEHPSLSKNRILFGGNKRAQNTQLKRKKPNRKSNKFKKGKQQENRRKVGLRMSGVPNIAHVPI